VKDAGLAETIETLRGSGFDFAAVIDVPSVPLDQPAGWEAQVEEFRRTVDIAAALGAPCIYSTSGNRCGLEWDDAVRAYSRLIRPVVDYAGSKGLGFLIEPTLPLYPDLSLVHTLRETVRVAEQAGIGVCIDVFHCWTDADLKE